MSKNIYKICPYCDNNFRPPVKSPNTKYCCKDHYLLAVRPVIKTKKCLNCNTTVESNVKKFCSLSCSASYNNKKRPSRTAESKLKTSRTMLHGIKVGKIKHKSHYSSSTKFKYKGSWFDSSWEVKLAKNLTKNNIKWKRKSIKPFNYCDEAGTTRYYFPDFYLPKHDIYLDPKNDYLIKKDKFKIQEVMKTHNVTIIILRYHQLTWNFIEKQL